jgi:hypothetical protein
MRHHAISIPNRLDGCRDLQQWERARRVCGPLGTLSRCSCVLGPLGRRLDPVGDEFDGPSSAAIGSLPLTAVQSPFDVDGTAHAETARGEVNELTPEDHVVKLNVALPVGSQPGRS